MKTLLRIVATAMLLPVIAPAQQATKEAPKPPTKGTLSVFRVVPKPGHTVALESAMRAHAQKFHSGNWKWRVSQIITGPDSGGYQIAEGPNSWTDIDGRGDLGAEHSKDFETAILPHVERMSPEMYATYEESASNVAAEAWSTKSVITHYYVKPARGAALLSIFRTFKAVGDKAGLNVVVWSSFNSGPGQYIVVRRLKNGFKDFDAGLPTLRSVYDSMHGAGAYERALDEIARCTERIESEIIEHKPELGSP
jgi:hypothetical protein